MRPSSTSRALVAFVALLASWLAEREAQAADKAEPRTSSLGWVRLPGAESCLGSKALAQAVEARLHRAVFASAAQADLAIEGRIERTRDPEGWRASITISDAAGAVLGARELSSAAPICSAMDAELALVLAVMIDPEAALTAPPTPPALPPLMPPPIVTPPKMPVLAPPPIASPPPRPWRARLGAGPVFSLGVLPSLGAGLRVHSSLTPPSFWTIALEGTLFANARAQQGTSGATLSLATAAVSLCPVRLEAWGATLSACGGVEVGALRASGFGFDLTEEHERPVVNARLASRVERRITGPLTFGLGLDLVVPTIRDQFFFGDTSGASRDVFQMSPIAAAMDLDLGVEFP